LYRDFQLYAMGGEESYARNLGSSKEGEGIIKLTQTGVRKYFELRKGRNNERLQKMLVAATFILAIGSTWIILKDILQPDFLFITGIAFSIAISLFFIDSARR